MENSKLIQEILLKVYVDQFFQRFFLIVPIIRKIFRYSFLTFETIINIAFPTSDNSCKIPGRTPRAAIEARPIHAPPSRESVIRHPIKSPLASCFIVTRQCSAEIPDRFRPTVPPRVHAEAEY